MKLSFLVAFSLGLFACMNASAANMLTNSNFDLAGGLSGWSFGYWQDTEPPLVCGSGTECGPVHISESDCCGASGSGSAAVSNGPFEPEALTQCVTGIAPNAAYDFGAWITRIETPGGVGAPGVTVAWYPSADCTSTAIRIDVQSYDATGWTRIALPGNVAPDGAGSAKFSLYIGPFGSASAPLEMRFDNAFFGPTGTVPVELQSFVVD